MTRAKRNATWALVLSFCLCLNARAGDGPPFQFQEKTGPYSVGLKILELYDYSRTFRQATDVLGKPFQGERARPLQTLIWYPSTKSDAKPMTVGDYVDLWATQTTFGPALVPTLAKEWREGMRPTLETPLWAVRDAPEMQGRFPVVIYAASFSRPSWENADLCEFLASHGYLVLGIPSMGALTRSMTMDVAGANAQAQDISFTISHARTLPHADWSQVAVAGYSWGGLANVFAAARDSRIDALVALDGSLRYFPALVKDSADVHPGEMTIPLLYFAQGEFSIEDLQRVGSQALEAPNVLNAWTHGDLLLVRMLALTHQGFSAMSQRNELDWSDSFPVWKKADYDRADAMAGYGWVARYTLWFLDAYLKHDAAAMGSLKKTPAQNGVPKHFLSASYRLAEGLPASLDGLRSEIGRRGFEHAAEAYADFRKQNPDFTPGEVELMSWADELIGQRRLSQALALLKLNAQIRPNSSAAYASLGDAYVALEQRELAIESYQKALERNPDNTTAHGKLNRLGAR